MEKARDLAIEILEKDGLPKAQKHRAEAPRRAGAGDGEGLVRNWGALSAMRNSRSGRTGLRAVRDRC